MKGTKTSFEMCCRRHVGTFQIQYKIVPDAIPYFEGSVKGMTEKISTRVWALIVIFYRFGHAALAFPSHIKTLCFDN